LATILLTHPTEELRTRFSDKAVAALHALGEVRVNGSEHSLSTDELIVRAQGCRVIFCDRLTPGEARLFAALPELVAFCRGAVDVRNIDVAAASANGVLVTHAAPTFVDAVAELTFGLMLDLARGNDARRHRLRQHRPARRGAWAGVRHARAGRRSLC
jgi:D-3-phosphoglycerate dehydrogenase